MSKPNLERIDINDINPAEYNPRIMYEQELEYLGNSIEEFGFVDPIIINLKNNRIIGGHQRYKLLQENEDIDELNIIRLGEIGWVFPDEELEVKSDDHEKALNIALNKISGKWDNAKLDSILDDFAEKDFDIELTGFTNLKANNKINDLSDGNDDFFNTVFTDMDDIDDLTSDDVVLSDSKTIIQCGDYAISVYNSQYNFWIRGIEKEFDFNRKEITDEIKRRLKLPY